MNPEAEEQPYMPSFRLGSEDRLVNNIPGVGSVWRIRFPRSIRVPLKGGGDEEVKERLLVVKPNGNETWTNEMSLASDLLGNQLSLF